MGACLGSGGGGTVPIPITELCGATGSVRGGVMLLFNMSTGIDAVSILLIGATVISTSSSWFTAAPENVRKVLPQPREADNHMLSFNSSKSRLTEIC